MNVTCWMKETTSPHASLWRGSRDNRVRVSLYWHSGNRHAACGISASVRALPAACATCRTLVVFRRSCSNWVGGRVGWALPVLLTWGRTTLLKIAIVAGATLTMLTAAVAADLPHRQPVYQEAQVGKMPIGKSPIGKSPIGKNPVGKSPIAARYWFSSCWSDRHRRRLKGEAWQIDRRDQDCACLRDSRSQFCSSAQSSPLLHMRSILAPVRSALPSGARSTDARLMRMRLFPVRRPLNQNGRCSPPESWGRDQQRVPTMSTSEPGPRRVGGTHSSGLERQVSERLKWRALHPQETLSRMCLAIWRGCRPRPAQATAILTRNTWPRAIGFTWMSRTQREFSRTSRNCRRAHRYGTRKYPIAQRLSATSQVSWGWKFLTAGNVLRSTSTASKRWMAGASSSTCLQNKNFVQRWRSKDGRRGNSRACSGNTLRSNRANSPKRLSANIWR